MNGDGVSKMLRPLKRRLGALFMRGTVLDVDYGGARVRVKVGLRKGEIGDFLELFEPHGFTAPPLPNRDGVVTLAIAGFGSNRIAFNAGGRYNRPNDIEPGEACVYNQHGDRVVIRNDRTIRVEGAERVQVDTRQAVVNASESVAINSPNVTINATFTHVTGALQVDGNINGRAMINDQYGTIQAIRLTYNGHNHTGDDGGSTSTPRQLM